MTTKAQLKESIIQTLQAGKKITVEWDCGSDEAIITVFLDGKEMSYGEGFSEALDFYLLDTLYLPDAGEFSMQGGGQLHLKNGEVELVYESRWKGYADKDGWKEVDEIDEDHTGTRLLFHDEE